MLDDNYSRANIAELLGIDLAYMNTVIRDQALEGGLRIFSERDLIRITGISNQMWRKIYEEGGITVHEWGLGPKATLESAGKRWAVFETDFDAFLLNQDYWMLWRTPNLKDRYLRYYAEDNRGESNPWYSLKEAARQTGHDRVSIQRVIKQGRLPARRLGGRIWIHQHNLPFPRIGNIGINPIKKANLLDMLLTEDLHLAGRDSSQIAMIMRIPRSTAAYRKRVIIQQRKLRRTIGQYRIAS